MKYRLFLLLVLPFLAWAQEPVVQLKTGDYSLPIGIQDQAFKKPFDGFHYGYLQSQVIFTSEQKKGLNAQGIEILDYLPVNTYHVKISASVNWNDVRSNNLIRSVLPIPPKHKLQAQLAVGNYPSHALITPDIIRVRASLFRDINPDLVSTLLFQAGFANHSFHRPTHTFIIDLDVTDLSGLTQMPFISFLAPIEPDPEPENLVGRTNHRSNVLHTSYQGGRKYDGAGVLVGMNDDGIIGPHADYKGRIDQSYVSGNSGNHGDHVAGIITGAGNINPTTTGMAPGASLYVYNVWDAIDFIDNYYYNPGIRLTSTSYGNGCNAGYTAYARTADRDVRELPSAMHIFSAGNSGTSNCGYGAGSGWGNITGGIKAGKNVMAIGNVTFQDNLANSSSRGPSSDGRIKPDLCAVGTSVLSTIDPHTYASFTGTSMACPGVTGVMAQLYQAYEQVYGFEPESGLIKAIMLNTADDLGNAGPDFRYGWGRVNARRAVEQIELATTITDSIETGNTKTFTIPMLSAAKELRVMVYWTDFEGSAGASKALVNDLDISLSDGTTTFSPWVLDHTPNATNLNTPATTGVDDRNNMEQVFVSDPSQGTYTLTVTGSAVPMGPQKFYIVVTRVEEAIDLTYPIGGEAFVPGTQETIRWDLTGGSGSIVLEYSTDNGSSWNNIATLGGSARFTNWSPPSTVTEQAKIRVSRGTLTDESDTSFVIAPLVTGLNLASACPDSLTFTWNAASGISSYEVMVLGNAYMDSLIQVSNATSATVSGVNPFNENWFTIRAVLPNGGKGRRAIAINPAPGLQNCQLTKDVSLETILSPGSDQFASCLDLDSVNFEVFIENEGLDTVQNLNIHYSMNGGTPVTEVLSSSLLPGASTTYQFSNPLDLSAVGTYNLVIWIDRLGDQNVFNDTLKMSIQVNPSQAYTLPYFESFDQFTSCPTSIDCGSTICSLGGNWTNYTNGTSDVHDWRTHSGSTASSNTGPNGDHSGGGNYLYTEASGGCEFVEGIAATPCIDLTGAIQPFVSWWTHMLGVGMGELHIDILVDGEIQRDLWVQSGNQGSSWVKDSIDVSAYAGKTIQVLFRGVTGSSFTSDIAIDDIAVRDAMALTADFDKTGDCVNQSVTFTDNSIGNVVSWSWDFGPNASPGTATGIGPHTVNFSKTTNRIELTVVDTDADSDSKVQVINLDTLPTGQISFVNNQPGEFDFDAQSTNASGYSWTFGDGNNSNVANPSHTYTSNGTYTVTVVLTNNCGTRALSDTVQVNNLSLEDELWANLEVFPNPSRGIVNVSCPDAEKDLDYRVYNELGMVMDAGILMANQVNQLNFAELPAGMYFLEIRSNTGSKRFELLLLD